MTTDKFLPYGQPSIGATAIKEVTKVLSTDCITRGPKVTQFERAVAKYCGADYAVAFSSGSAALQAAYGAVDADSYDRILTTPNTYIATVSGGVGRSVTRGAKLQFLDIDRSKGAFDLEQLESHLCHPATRGKTIVVPVHFAGICMDMEKMERMVYDPNTVIIEDAAHAIGSSYPTGEKVGCSRYSDMTVFSFHPVKTLTTGEGGMVTTNDEELFERLKRYRNNGVERRGDGNAGGDPWYYEVQEFSSNHHLTDFQAALGLCQLKRLSSFVEKRRRLVQKYRKCLSGVDGIEGIKLFSPSEDDRTAFHLFVVQIDFDRFHTTRRKVMDQLRAKEIGSQVHYIPLYRHPAVVKRCGELVDRFPEMEKYYAQALTLPLYFDLTAKDVERVCGELLKILKKS